MENKKVLALSLGSIVFFIFLLGVVGYVYQLNRKVNALIHVPTSTVQKDYILENRVNQLEQQKSSGDMENTNYASFPAGVYNELYKVANDHFADENIVELGNSFRLSYFPDYFFSFDIPKTIIKSKKDILFNLAQQNERSYWSSDVVLYPNESNERYIVDMKSESTWEKDALEKQLPCAGGQYSEEYRYAAMAIEDELQTLLSEGQPNVQKVDLDVCKYLDIRGEGKSTYWSFMQRKPSVLKPNVDTQPEKWYVFSLNTKMFVDKKMEDDFSGKPIPRLIAFVQFGKEGNNSASYRLFRLGWAPSYPLDVPFYSKEHEEKTKEVEAALNQFQESVVKSAVVLPVCEYGCGY